MTRLTMMEGTRKYVKEYAGAAIAASLMFSGILQLVSVLSRPIADALLRLINAIIQTGFRDRMPLRNLYYGGAPWWLQATIVAGGSIAVTLGILVGLWVNSRNQHEPTS